MRILCGLLPSYALGERSPFALQRSFYISSRKRIYAATLFSGHFLVQDTEFLSTKAVGDIFFDLMRPIGVALVSNS